LLCDEHDPDVIAYGVGTDLSGQDLSYGESRRKSATVAAALRSLGIGPVNLSSRNRWRGTLGVLTAKTA
jgi:hypothetical protein